MSTATIGRAREYAVRDAFVRAGWESIGRFAASKGPADLALAHSDYGLALVQVGSRTKTLGPADRARLLRAAQLCSALPVLAVVIPREAIRYWLVADCTPSRWQEWKP